MELVTRKSECRRNATGDVLIKSPKEITKKHTRSSKYCIIVKPFHASFLPYKQIVFRGVTFSDDFSIELIRNNETVLISNNNMNELQATNIFQQNGENSFRIIH